MAFDGITVAALTYELNNELKDGHISKIAQPEEDELILTVKTQGGLRRLLISASATLPLVYLTDTAKQSPATAPAFCMLLRKHLSGARILAITQPGLERVIHIDMEHRDEMGDMCTRRLIVEIMGKHSNIIFTNEEGVIIDSIKRISAAVSSVREVLPGRTYFLPETQDKADPLSADQSGFTGRIKAVPAPLYKAIYGSYTGISPMMATEIVARAGLDGDLPTSAYDDEALANLYKSFDDVMSDVKEHRFTCQMFLESDYPKEYCVLPLTAYDDLEKKSYPSASELLSAFYSERNAVVNIRQRSADLRKVVTTALERNVKKYDLQCRQMKDTEKRDKYRVYGELINTYGYGVESGASSMKALNYYTGEEITIPLDKDLTTQENAQKYFEKYNKLKRTYEALSTLTVEVSMEIDHLESVLTSLDIARSEDDLLQIREELMQSGIIRRKNTGKKVKITSKPFHYVTDDGFHIYVGKNNLQNDELTFKFANGNDWWFHAKKIPGSHVVLRTEGREIPDRVFELAAAAAAYYSKGAAQPKVEVDYVPRKEVKKPAGAKPGFVVYYTNYSMAIEPSIAGLSDYTSGPHA